MPYCYGRFCAVFVFGGCLPFPYFHSVSSSNRAAGALCVFPVLFEGHAGRFVIFSAVGNGARELFSAILSPSTGFVEREGPFFFRFCHRPTYQYCFVSFPQGAIECVVRQENSAFSGSPTGVCLQFQSLVPSYRREMFFFLAVWGSERSY